MMIARFYLPPPAWSGEELLLTGEEARHCAQVTRHREGDCIGVFDGCGRLATGPITALSREQVRMRISELTTTPAPAHPLTLVQAMVKGDTMEWIIEKAVELGAQRVIPWAAQRSIVRLNGSEAVRKREKWQRVALEACKQCGQTWLPEVAVPATLDQVLEETATAGLRLAASLQPDARSLRQLLGKGPPPPGGMAVLIGPEGDVTPDEAIKFQAAGWLPWSLGALTLRSETAAICALSILRYEVHTD